MTVPTSVTRQGSDAHPWVVMGGTFDPIHYGHLRSAFELLNLLEIPTLHFMPTGQPYHRPAQFAPNALRVRMLEAAIQEEPRFAIDERELNRPGPSYTIDSLEELRVEHPRQSICFVVGLDAFLTQAHVIVVHRPGFLVPEDGVLKTWLDDHQTTHVADLRHETHGRIYLHEVTPLAISSTAIRTLLKNGQDPQFLLPSAVRAIISEHRCYSN